jgi:hypothetical protein
LLSKKYYDTKDATVIASPDWQGISFIEPARHLYKRGIAG